MGHGLPRPGAVSRSCQAAEVLLLLCCGDGGLHGMMRAVMRLLLAVLLGEAPIIGWECVLREAVVVHFERGRRTDEEEVRRR